MFVTSCQFSIAFGIDCALTVLCSGRACCRLADTRMNLGVKDDMKCLHEAAGLRLTATRVSAILAALFLMVPAYAQTKNACWDKRDIKTVSVSFDFNNKSSPLQSNSHSTSSVKIDKKNTEWISVLRDHKGVLGLKPDIAGRARLQLDVGNLLRGNGPKQVKYQFDAFLNSAKFSTKPENSIYGITKNKLVSIDQLRYGWVRISGIFDIIGKPKQQMLTWTFDKAFFGNVAIDNLSVSTKPSTDFVPVPEPGSIAALGTGVIGLLLAKRKRS